MTMKSLVESSVQKPVFVPESMDIMKVVPVFREHSVHEAAVLDEYGNFSGLLTLHDILEELVGSMPSGEKKEKRKTTTASSSAAPTNGSWRAC